MAQPRPCEKSRLPLAKMSAMLSLAPITGLGFEHVVCTENQDPAILVMEAAKDRLCCDGTEALNRPMERGILV